MVLVQIISTLHQDIGGTLLPIMRYMRIFNKRPCCLAVVTLLWLLPIGCEEPSNSEHIVQETIDMYLNDLDDAVGRNNVQLLKTLISRVNGIRPVTPAQTQSKNLLLSTASGKLAQLQYQTISATTNAVSAKLQLAVTQAVQVAQLRWRASTLTAAGYFLPDNANLVQAIESGLDPLQATFNTQLREASARISKLETQSESSREEAMQLRITANALFEEAEQAGIIDGSQSYGIGVQTMRKSQQVDLAAATIELQSKMEFTLLHEDAKAELEAIASILAGIQYTGDLLQKWRNSSIDSASKLRQLADELDENAARVMNEATDAASSLTEQWNEVTSLLQDAIQASRSRATGREEKKAAALWKLNLEWTLGQIEESKSRFLKEEAQALSSIIESGIETNAGKWQALSNSTSAAVEQATINAITAYENAKRLAGSVGSQSDIHTRQLNRRISNLQGKPMQEMVVPTKTFQPTPVDTPQFDPSTAGFSSPQALITAFNQLPMAQELDGTQPAPDYSEFYTASDEMSQKFIDFQQGMLSGIANLLIAIRTNMGESAVAEFKTSVPLSGAMIIKLDPSSLSMSNDNEASVNDGSRKTYNLQNTQRGWIILLKSNDEGAEMAAMMFEMLAPMIEIMNQATQQINDGQITSFDQLEAMMESAMGM